MWNDPYSVLRTNGLLFVSGFLFMSALAGLGAVLGPAPAPEGASGRPVWTVDADRPANTDLEPRALASLARELARTSRF